MSRNPPSAHPLRTGYVEALGGTSQELQLKQEDHSRLFFPTKANGVLGG